MIAQLQRPTRSLPLVLGLAAGAALARYLTRRRGPDTEGAETVGPAYGETTPHPGTHTFSLHLTADGRRSDEAVEALRQQLGPNAVRDPDDNGFLEVSVEGDSWDAAATRLRDAIASAGADEAVELGEPSGRVDGDK